tara:strand:- start:591 stop:701 length:111 start_codon:yes stop_codon:yes gene_type:complete
MKNLIFILILTFYLNNCTGIDAADIGLAVIQEVVTE